MSYGFLDIATTPGVRAVQAEMGADRIWQDFEGERPSDRFTAAEAGFIADRDSFYMATVSETGWPYVQHRGGPAGFLKLIDDMAQRMFADAAAQFVRRRLLRHTVNAVLRVALVNDQNFGVATKERAFGLSFFIYVKNDDGSCTCLAERPHDLALTPALASRRTSPARPSIQTSDNSRGSRLRRRFAPRLLKFTAAG